MMPDEAEDKANTNAAPHEETIGEEVQHFNADATKVADAVTHLEKWVVDHLHNSPVSQNTDVMNRIRANIEAIKREIQNVL